MNKLGIDIGSTTVKIVVLDKDKNIIFSDYKRHLSHTQTSLAELLEEADKAISFKSVKVKLTGSGSINLAKSLNIGFVQEVVAVASALKLTAPQTDVAIELGGEDAKIIYFTDGLGIYPPSKPAYRTAFVFVESGYNVPEVPVWAMKVVLRPDEL